MKVVQIIAKILKTMESMQAEMQKMEKLPYYAGTSQSAPLAVVVE